MDLGANKALTDRLKRRLGISIVVPIYNEAESLLPLYEAISRSCQTLDRTYEIIFVDDGSRDQSFSCLRTIHENDFHVKVVRFRKNYGPGSNRQRERSGQFLYSNDSGRKETSDSNVSWGRKKIVKRYGNRRNHHPLSRRRVHPVYIKSGRRIPAEKGFVL